jgi:hypothetical protein
MEIYCDVCDREIPGDTPYINVCEHREIIDHEREEITVLHARERGILCMDCAEHNTFKVEIAPDKTETPS